MPPVLSRGPHNPALQPSYPCYCVKVKNVILMVELEPHDTLKRKGALVKYEPGMVVIFVSHQWLSLRHPDPLMLQFRVLQNYLVNAIKGQVKTETYWMSFLYFHRDEAMDPAFMENAYIWYDYFSVPQGVDRSSSGHTRSSQDSQSDFLNAVHSIPIYVSMCKWFFVLCPSMKHESGEFCDFLSWSRRGWCQCEEISRRLSHFTEMVVVVTGDKQAVLHDSQDYLSHSVGTLDFACCQMKHLKDGQSIPCDKVLVSGVIQGLLSRLVDEKSFKEEDIFHFRLVKSLSPSLLSDLPDVLPCAFMGNADAFLSDFRFSRASILCVCAAQERPERPSYAAKAGDPGWGPLFWAALKQDLDVINELVRRGHDVDERSTEKAVGVLVDRGSTPLLVAAMLSGKGLSVRTLLDLKADHSITNQSGLAPLGASCIGGHPKNTMVLLEWGADISASQDDMDGQALLMASSFSRTNVCRVLVESKADIDATNIWGATALHGASMAGDMVNLKYLLDHKADVDKQHVPRTTFAKVGYFAVNSLLAAGLQKQALQGIGHAHLGSSLLSAALHGHTHCVTELLLRRADLNVRNNNGKSAQELAELRSHMGTLDLLCTWHPPSPGKGPLLTEEEEPLMYTTFV
ncbi:unnamed protein product [Polarella glacialis]|uniref:Uncharacterized protein n=1 Tax=Polarella glacialis TaxID=89957 RepID=A0A813GPT7_POLGL|nr:unnamed protein product [Polarella glacialis]